MELTFIPSDFVNLNNPILHNTANGTNDSTEQFVDTKDCPTVRMAERHGIHKDSIEWDSVYIALFYNVDKLNEIREQLLAGEESVTVTI